MVKKRKAYTLRYGESQQNDMLVYFDDSETIQENLLRLIPSAVQRGFLPPECSAENVKLLYNDRPLNLNVSMSEQEVNIDERAILTIQDMSSTVRIKVNYKPDNHAGRSDTVYVNPNKILGKELKKFFDGVTKEYKFYRRKPKKYHLVTESGKVNLNKSLAAQGVESGFDATLAPRLILRWPPSKPVIGVVGVVVLAALVFVMWSVYVRYLQKPPVIDRFYVTFHSDAEAKLITPDTTVALSTGIPVTLAFNPDVYDLEVMPKDYPIFPYRLELYSEGAVRDSVSRVVNITSRFAGAVPLLVNITAYQGGEDPENRVKTGLSINGYPRQLNEFGELPINLLRVVSDDPAQRRGLYEIKYDLDEQLLDVQHMKFDPKVLRPSTFRFDFSNVDGEATFITFHYFPSR